MYRKPYPYHPTYFYPVPPQYQENYFGYQPHPNFNAYNPNYNAFSYESPFEQYEMPEQPQDWLDPLSQQNQSYYQPSYPQQQQLGLLAQFKTETGEMDFDKMLSTVGQLANTVQQVSPVIKQFGTLMKSFK